MSNTLFPSTLKLNRENGDPIELKVYQIKLVDYDKALAALNRENEFGLVAISAATNEQVIKSLTPDSYELLRAEVWKANEKGFFIFARRRADQARDKMMLREMASQVLASPDLAAKISQASSPASPPKPD